MQKRCRLIIIVVVSSIVGYFILSLMHTGAKRQQKDSEVRDTEIEELARLLEIRIKENKAFLSGARVTAPRCSKRGRRSGPCVNVTCSSSTFPTDARTRMRSLMTSTRVRMTFEQREKVKAIAEHVAPRKYIFVTAASHNHYLESQAHVHNLQTLVFPKLPRGTWAFYYFDLGLDPVERRRAAKHCNCTVLPSPVHVLPESVQSLKCYTWKPLIISALLPKAEVLVYMDASVRFHEKTNFEAFFAHLKLRGLQIIARPHLIPQHTIEETFRWFGEDACPFWPYYEMEPSFLMVANDKLIRRAIIEPWLACAFSPTCMCPPRSSKMHGCAGSDKSQKVGVCHRFDQSALSILLVKLYGRDVIKLNLPRQVAATHTDRKSKMNYFTD